MRRELGVSMTRRPSRKQRQARGATRTTVRERGATQRCAAARASGCALLALLALLGGAAFAEEPAIRDLRPLQIEAGDKVTVEANGSLFLVGAPTRVMLKFGAGTVEVAGRAVSSARVLFDADAEFHKQLAPFLKDGHLLTEASVSVTNNGAVFHSAPNAPFEVDLFPRSLQKLARGLAEKMTGGANSGLWQWLGLTLEPAPGGIAVKAVAGISSEDSSAPPAAATSGLVAGDLITAADGKPVASLDSLAAAWKSSEGIAVALTVQRATGAATISLPAKGQPIEIPGWILFALCMALAAGIVALPVPVIGGLIVVWERKISAYMQSRIGPNRVGPNGWLQWLADGLKLIMKEDLIPAEADPILFRASPYLAFVGLFLVFMVLPFTQWVIVADLNVGLLFLLSVTSLVVVSIIMGGWSSNSKWSLLGGMRSAAQIISYELPASVALLTIATLTGSLSTEAIVRAQGGAPWNWYLFRNPFTFAAFFIYFISALAEGNRTPFDLPEAESELVSGYNTEYSGFRFSLFPLVEWVNLFVIGAIAGMLFCGGWRIPGISLAEQDLHGYWQLVGAGLFLAKIIGFIFIIIWIRWTLPRFRVDQMMNLCWKFFIPISFACFVGVLSLVWLLPGWADISLRFATFAVGGVVPLVIFFKKVQYNRARYQELRLNPLL